MAQKVRTHHIFAQRNEAVFCLTTRFIRAKWKMDLHYCSEYDKKQAILREDLFSLTYSMLGIIDLVWDLTWLRSEISYRINLWRIFLRWVWCCFVVAAIPWKWSFSIGSNKENEFSSSWLPFTFFLLHHSWFSTPPLEGSIKIWGRILSNGCKQRIISTKVFVKRSQYIRIKNPLHKQSEKACICF